MTEDEADKRPDWNYALLILALLISFVMQSYYLPCLCNQGNMKISLALYFDLFIIARMLFALNRKEKGGGWLLYMILLYTSPLWITLLVSLMFKIF